MRVRRRIIMILLIFFCFLLQSTLFQSTFAVADVAPNLMLILTVSFGLMRGKREGMFVGFLGGILSDLFFGSALGFTALLYVIIGYCCGFCYRIFYDDDVKMPVILIAVSDIGYGTAMYMFQFLLRGRVEFFFYLRRVIIPEMIYTVVVTLVVYRLLLLLNRKLEKAERPEAPMHPGAFFRALNLPVELWLDFLRRF